MIDNRVKNLPRLFALVKPVPEEWFSPAEAAAAPSKDDELDCLDCSKWKTLIQAWRKALKWTDGLDCALSVMLASIASTRALGDQLWVKIIGPASCGKSTLCEAVSINRDYVLAKSTIRGFHSGFQVDREGKEDVSLIAQVRSKTLVTKDGDTLLQSPNLGQILAEARDLYDSTARTHYRNNQSRDYSGVRMTWILCGTASLRSIDSSELGERFLDCVIMDGIDDDLEDEILWRVANRANSALSFEASEEASSQYQPELARAMGLTGGYVSFLRKNASKLLTEAQITNDYLRRITRLGKFVAFMRARPSNSQDETAEREFAARLVSQHTRLAKCLAVVLNKKQVDEEVMDRTKKVALDTARGQTLNIVTELFRKGLDGSELKGVAMRSNLTEDKCRTLLRFLREIGVVNYIQKKKGLAASNRWRLTDKMIKLYAQVVGGTDV